MSLTLQSLVDRAVNIALAGRDITALSLNVEDIAEDLAPTVFYGIARRAASDPRRKGLVENTLTVALTNGVGTLTAVPLIEFMDDSTVSDPADATMSKKMRYIRQWRDFIRPLDSTLGYFIVKNGTEFNMTRPGSAYTPGSGMTGNVSLTAPCVPQIPTLATDTIVIAPGLEEEAVLALAEAITGQYARLGVQEAA